MITVAIVEDDDEIRNTMRLIINGSDGFSCTDVYASAENALEELPAKKTDVVIMDINLPAMDGIACMSQLKDQMLQSQFMMFTVHDVDDKIFSALESGATGYILKGTQPAQILEAIRDLHAGGSPMNTEIARRIVKALQKKKLPSLAAEILSDREKEVLDFMSKGYLYKEIADELFISKATVKRHIHGIYEKLQVQNRTEALNKAFPR